MNPIRIIPKIDIKGPNLVKGINLEGYRVLGQPWDFAEYYFKNDADEIFFNDVVASLYKRNLLFDIVKKASENIFIPITIGGGIRTIGDISTSLRIGADKVAINSAALKNPKFISEAANIFGSANIVIMIEAIMYKQNYYAAYENGRENSGKKVLDWIKQIEEYGAGEILLIAVDRDGVGNGFDLNLMDKISDNINIPVILNGGFASIKDIFKTILYKNVQGISLSSMLHYNALKFIEKMNVNEELFTGNRTFIDHRNQYKKFGKISIKEIKNNFLENNLAIRK